MDLSPNDIRSYEFPSQMRGYDKDEVDNLLDQVANALEAARQDNLKLSMEVDSLKSQLAAVKQVEDSIKSAAIDARRNADATISAAKEEAEQIRQKAQEESRSSLQAYRQRMEELQNQLRQLETTKKSYIERFRTLVESHQDIVNEIAEQQFPEIPDIPDVPDIPDTPEQSAPVAGQPDQQQSQETLEVTDSAEMRGERKEALHQAPSKPEPVRPEEANAPDPSVMKPPQEDSEASLDPELAAALRSYQHEYADKPPKQPDASQDEETTVPPHQPQPEPPQKEPPPPAGPDAPWLETNRKAEDIPPGFIARDQPQAPGQPPAQPERVDDNGESDTQAGEAEVPPDVQDQPTEHNTISMDEQEQNQGRSEDVKQSEDIAKELDEVVAKFEEEMDKADKNQ